MNNTNPWKVLCFVCMIILGVWVIYELNNYFEENNIQQYQEGYVNGSQDTLIVIMNKALNCENIPLRYNETVGVNLLDIGCLPKEVLNYLRGDQQNG